MHRSLLTILSIAFAATPVCGQFLSEDLASTEKPPEESGSTPLIELPDEDPILLSEPPTTTYTPSEGLTVSMLNGTSKLRLFAQFSTILEAATDRPFPAGGTLFLLPTPDSGNQTNTFDLHARQTAIGAIFSGPELAGFNTGATFIGFIQNDNLTSDAYGFLPFNAYIELRNEEWRISAGLQEDVFNPVTPTTISLLNLYASGNTGSFRGQVRGEHFYKPSDEFQLTSQFAIGEPVASVLSNNRLIEDNGWPNIEGRLAAGFGELQELIGRRNLRAVEVGLSGLIGQMRNASLPGAFGPPPVRSTITIWGLGADVQAAFTDRFGLAGEFFTGQGLGEYSGGIGQTFGDDLRAIRTTGGWAEAYYYFNDNLHLHGGYGIDAPAQGDLSPTQIARNQTYFAILVWDVNRSLQVSFETDYRQTDYIALRDAEGMVFMSQFLWRF